MTRRAASSGVSATAFMLATPALLISTSSVLNVCLSSREQPIDRGGVGDVEPQCV